MSDDLDASHEETWPPQWQPLVIGIPRGDEDVFRWSPAPQDDGGTSQAREAPDGPGPA